MCSWNNPLYCYISLFIMSSHQIEKKTFVKSSQINSQIYMHVRRRWICTETKNENTEF